MAVTNAITDLVKSIAELFSSVFNAVYSIVHSFITNILALLASFLALFGDLGKGVIDLVGGVGRFVAGNVVVLGVVAAAGYAYIRFVQQPQQQGRKPAIVNGAGAKKVN
ncbi:hypothetical protein BT67DRAFT_448864 [Trichocladium antarcticum]|uniref:Uncharacterized protein n=1 Tax=Trichocladium antarcticum TaxID=1450529 RepID=A0AAN6UM62_9PEZI|nr:hypothetical protein BT67DRAFT_448864 [Trichocladium antarcticum]